jgi:hypothetical protein
LLSNEKIVKLSPNNYEIEPSIKSVNSLNKISDEKLELMENEQNIKIKNNDIIKNDTKFIKKLD